MSKEIGVILLGFMVVVTTQLGVPGAWRSALLVLVGFSIATLGFLLRAEALSREGRPKPKRDFSFVDNVDSHSAEHEREQVG